jgi:hypothetical protein
VLAAACAASAGGLDRPSPDLSPAGLERAMPDLSPPRFERRVPAFPVADSTGRSYDHPFLGGFNVPRPQLVDIDADGDLDLFVQEAADRIAFFERLDGPQIRFEWRTDRFAGLEVGEWYRFADLDADGDPDLLGEAKFSLIRAWENRGPVGVPHFAGVVDTLWDTGGSAIFSDRQNIPNVVDFDCDGRLDLMLGRLDGSVTRYEAAAPWQGGEAPTFEFVTDDFEGILIVAQITPSLHGANTLVFADIDGDGDKDLMWGDFFEPGLLILENIGSCERPAFSNQPVSFPRGDPLATSGYNASTFGDVDGDGDLDAIVGVLGGAYNPITTAAENLYLLTQEADGWRVVTRRLIDQIDIGAESVPAAGDLDGDGDPDLLLGNKIDPRDPRSARIYRLENVGTEGRPEFRLAGALDVKGGFHYAPALADLDADGDLDLVVGTWNEDVQVHWNEGSPAAPRFAAAPEPLVELSRGSHASPDLADLDGDGDLDLAAGESSGELNLWRNDGTPREPSFVLVTDKLAGFDAGRRSAPAFADLDGDGSPDLLVGSESGGTVVLWNRGGALEAMFGAMDPALELPGMAAPVFADLDADGDPDLLVGEIAGGLRYYENEGP